MFQINEMVDIIIESGHVKRGKVAEIINAPGATIYKVIDTTDQMTIYSVGEYRMRKVL